MPSQAETKRANASSEIPAKYCALLDSQSVESSDSAVMLTGFEGFERRRGAESVAMTIPTVMMIPANCGMISGKRVSEDRTDCLTNRISLAGHEIAREHGHAKPYEEEHHVSHSTAVC